MEPILEANGVKALAGGTAVVSGVELRLLPGEIVWVGGVSGAGKTTVLRALARLSPWEGELRSQGQRAGDVVPHRWRAWVTLVPFPPVALADRVAPDLKAPWGLRVRREARPPGPDTFRTELDALGLADIGLDRSVGELSQGQLARLALIRALLAGPKVLLLDEPDANLDPDAAGRVCRRVARFAAAGGAAVVAGHGAPWPGVARRYRIRDGQWEAAG